MPSMLFENAAVLDTVAGEILEDHHVLVADGRITEVSDTPITTATAEAVDLGGRVLMPGLCDAHVHVTVSTPDLALLRRWSPYYVTARATGILRAMLRRGFTTVRDAGGADYGLAQAVEEGHIEGPRILHSGKALSQTGGHGDMRGRGENDSGDCYCRPGLGRLCDGVTEVRRAARDEIRKGARQIKIMVSGGVASPTDPIANIQYSEEEMTAAVSEAAAAETYVMAHAYTSRATTRALHCGIRSIEHGNLVDEDCIRLLIDKGAFLVPTLATYKTLTSDGLAAGMPPELHANLGALLERGMEALETADRLGAKLAYGTDLLGDLHEHQSLEFMIMAEVQKPIDVIRAATVGAAELFNMTGELGVVAPGARADLLVVDGDPLADLGLLQDQGRHMMLIMKDGEALVNRLR